MIHASPTLVIAASLRPRRIALHIAEWVAKVGRETTDSALEVVDLKDWPLPMDDEPHVPATSLYEHEHTAPGAGRSTRPALSSSSRRSTTGAIRRR
ncbi:MAG: hypothetical protein WDM85_13440 [Caulobacteraceae bacterium]